MGLSPYFFVSGFIMTAPVPLTRLAAVNLILRNVGLFPTNSLTGDITADVTVALAALDEAHLNILEEGWEFNTEPEYTLSPNASTSKITLPSNVIRFRSTTLGTHLVVRDGFLYDVDEKTFLFDDDITVEVVLSLDWDDLPHAAKRYIATKAARQFAHEQLENPDAGKLNESDELRARAVLSDAESENARHSHFDTYDTWSHLGQDREAVVY